MIRECYRYSFPDDVSLEDVKASLLLAVMGTESLHGAQVRLDAHQLFDTERRCCVIDASSPAGRDLNRLFAGFLSREFGDAFEVERIEDPAQPLFEEEVA